MVPWNFREPPKDKLKFEFCNRFVILPVTLRLYNDFKVGIQAVKKDFQYLKTTFAPYGMYFLSQILLQLPFPFASALLGYLSNKPTIFLTNLYFGNVPFELAGGAKSHKIYALCTFFRGVPGGICVISHRDSLSLSFSADKGKFEET